MEQQKGAIYVDALRVNASENTDCICAVSSHTVWEPKWQMARTLIYHPRDTTRLWVQCLIRAGYHIRVERKQITIVLGSQVDSVWENEGVILTTSPGKCQLAYTSMFAIAICPISLRH